MWITIKLFATFRRDRFKEARREYPLGTAIGDVIAELGIEAADVGMIFVQGRSAESGQELRDGDALSLFPLLGGG
jgi:sulfur-carrier protein